MTPCELSVAQAADAVAARLLSPVELVESVLDRLERVEPQLRAYVTVVGDRARDAARRAEREIAAGAPRGPLHGVPMGLKDLIDVAGLPTSASSRVRRGHRATRDSVVAARLSAAGAILLGKTHTHEFACGGITPGTANARDHTRIAGGSSGGSAVAVAAGSATFAVGTDTAGSIRIPSSLNGVVGLKPTSGLVSMRGITPLSWSLDHVGPITRTVEDAALVLDAMAPTPGYRPSPGTDLTGLRVGVPRDYFFDRIQPDVERAVRRATDALAALGAELVEVEVPMARYIAATQFGVMLPEAAAYHQPTLRTVPELYTDDVRFLLEVGALIPVTDHLRAQRARTLFRREWTRVLSAVDVLATPTLPATAVPAGQETVTWPTGETDTVTDACIRLTMPADLAGLPALTVPAGRDAAGLPIGLQLMARPHAERMLLGVGHAYELGRPSRDLAPVGDVTAPG